MAYITKGKARSWEIRVSEATARGPRSRTLATFAELDEGVIARAASRAAGPLDAEELRREALRKGAPLAEATVARAARELIAALSRGETLRPGIADLLAAAIADRRSEPSAAARAAAPWLDADPARRAEALADLLLLVDRIPPGHRRGRLTFPRLETGPE